MNERSAYRLVVFKKDAKGANSFVSILSQSSIIAYIALKMSSLNGNDLQNGTWELGKKSILELGLIANKKMMTIPTTSTV